MRHSYYIIGIFIAAILGWASFIAVIIKLSPFISGYLALSLFYASLFISLTGTLTIANYYLRTAISKEQNYYRHLNTSLRQGSLLAIMICVGLAFQRLRVLTWWDALIIFIIIMLVEYYFMNRE